MTDKQIKMHHIRNCTEKLFYSGLVILVDPFFTPKGYYPGFDLCPTLEGKKTRVPLVDLKVPIDEIIKDIDAIIVTHTHFDHWDEYTSKYIPKFVPIFVQNISDKKIIQNQGFSDVRVLGINVPFKGITITKTLGQHGTDQMFSNTTIAENFGESMGFVLKAPGLKTIYFTGDTIYHDYVELALKKHKPDIIVAFAADCRYEGLEGSSMMGPNDIKKLYDDWKNSTIIAVHMDSFCHGASTIESMKKFAKEKNIQDRVIVPTDNEILKL